ncbi:MAG: NAD(+) diphosphatase [Paludibacteraceae bacterium]|nr:NAD(+) diphosphatase [Paludibacteraceae bacterium]
MIIENPAEFSGKCYALQNRDRVVRADGSELSFADLKRLGVRAVGFIAEPENNICAMELSSTEELPAGYMVKTIRQSFFELADEDDFSLTRARAIVTWHMNFKFCPNCGGRLLLKDDETAKYCPTCGKIHFPRIEPCVIVLVRKGDKILLGRHVQRNQNVYSTLAGFIEVGETAERAVAREIFEETGIRVKNIQFKGTQSWPFPDQLMLAFTAEYESGEIKVKEDELSAAGWFDADNCPATPSPGSVAYRLIHNLI